MKLPEMPARPAELPVLEARLAELGAERQEVQDKLRRISIEAWEKTQLDIDPLDRAAELLASGAAEATSRTIAPEQAGVLRSRLELLQAAECKVRQKFHEMRDLHNVRVARAFRPMHRKAVKRIAVALAELVAANIAEGELCDRVPGRQLRSASFPNCGRFGPHGDPCQIWRNYVKREGLLDDDDPAKFSAAAS